MKIVTITADLRPWRNGQDAVVPDALADSLIKEGNAKDPRPYPPPDVAPQAPVRAQEAPKRPVLSIGRRARKA